MAYRPGNAEDFQDLYQRQQERLIGFLYRRLGDRELAEESAADAWLRAWEHWGEWKPTGKPESWVLAIALHQAVSRIRHSAVRSRESTLLLLAKATPPDPAQTVVNREVWAALRRLPVKQRQVFVLRYCSGLSNRQVAAQLGLAYGTVSSRLAAAKRQLRWRLS